MSDIKAFNNQVGIQWCPGCPNFGILQAVKKALAELGKAPHEVCLVSGIGQAAKLPHYLNCNFFNGLHGRALPAALGIHCTNPSLTTLVTTGEGDCYGEGGNHFIHTVMRNSDITVLVHNNEFYALTKGQASPTTLPGEKRALQQKGVEKAQLNMPALSVANGCTFVARGFAGEIDHLTDLIVRAVKHRGFSHLEVIQPCITWSKKPVSWYRERIYKLDSDYDPGDRDAALKILLEQTEKKPIGVLYQTQPRKTMGARFRQTISDRPLSELKPIGAETIQSALNDYRPD